ncbi:hypothetical protein Amet_1811 [Alkaliphilus metalliredigens QYMF]|uniref:Uncharacterized protein n=1 Tax=Alkaliphilus metalliredigens (strain QYMF) TaxID=293826 RepID=A6TP63_ALKMQ|nr:hypothetical protein [Alkaliphilus metalliredigens]ABR47981.1 hypothetical protein Amet_1811 [Alkaliphilus metalliredigens QYMF]
MDEFWFVISMVGVVLMGGSAMLLRSMNGQYFGYSIFKLKEPYKNIVKITYPRVFFCFLLGLIMIIVGSVFFIEL